VFDKQKALLTLTAMSSALHIVQAVRCQNQYRHQNVEDEKTNKESVISLCDKDRVTEIGLYNPVFFDVGLGNAFMRQQIW